MRRTPIFQSTLPLRGATVVVHGPRKRLGISIHAPLAGSDGPHGLRPRDRAISIHAPLAGSDTSPSNSPVQPSNFNPRSPCGERPNSRSPCAAWFRISIHAPLAGSDRNLTQRLILVQHFNPRSPCGERQNRLGTSNRNAIFQSTLPLRGATRLLCMTHFAY